MLGPAALADSDGDCTQAKSKWQSGFIAGALWYNPVIKSEGIQVQVQQDQATLSGYVDSEVTKALAEQIALGLAGIDSVLNQLQVTPNKFAQGAPAILDTDERHRLSNVTITNKVRSQLLANRQTSGIDIGVETKNRMVTLSGTVASDAERQLAHWVVRNTRGVKEVNNQLHVGEMVHIQAGVAQ